MFVFVVVLLHLVPRMQMQLQIAVHFVLLVLHFLVTV